MDETPNAPIPARGALLLGADEVRALMTPADYLLAVTDAFGWLARSSAAAPAPLHLSTERGGFHAKAAAIVVGGSSRVALKFNANFPANPQRHGLPTIQGTLLLCDGDDGRLLALMDAAALTIGRTAAATALAARHLARADARWLLVCGCGAQAFAQVEALAAVRPLRDVVLFDLRPECASALAQRVRETLGLEAHALADAAGLPDAACGCDVVVACSTSTAPYLRRDMVRPGTFVAAVGADNPHKSEIAPELMASARVVVDLLSQCLVMGDLRHAVAAGAMRADQVHGELADLVSGRLPGRTSDDEITLFDSTGVAVQDVASALRVVALAHERGLGRRWDLSGGSDAA